MSQHDGPFSWVAGYFESEYESFATSEEFTPEFDLFAIENFGGIQERPDSLEYFQVTDQYEKESALYGEFSFRPLHNLAFTVGYRKYRFDVDSTGGFDIPLARTVFDGDDPNSIEPDLSPPQSGFG